MRKKRRNCCVKRQGQPSEELRCGKEGSGPAELGDLPFPFIVKEQTQERDIYVNRAQTSYTLNNKSTPSRGKLGRKNQTLCVQLNIFSNFIL